MERKMEWKCEETENSSVQQIVTTIPALINQDSNLLLPDIWSWYDGSKISFLPPYFLQRSTKILTCACVIWGWYAYRKTTLLFLIGP
jgi:hypothetical protein